MALEIVVVEPANQPDSLATCLFAQPQRYQLRLCGSMEAAVSHLQKASPDVVLLDICVEVGAGLELIEQIRQVAPWVAIVLQASQPDDLMAARALDRGAQDFLIRGHAHPEILDRTLRHAVRRQQVYRENQRLVSELEQIARIDTLTGVHNRHFFTQAFQREWSRVSRSQSPLSCVVLDIDWFKRVNDTHGHPIGDEVLRAVADVLRRQCRSADGVGRFGGEEFCAYLPDTDEEGGAAWAERVRKEIARIEVPAGLTTVSVTASFGVAERLTDTASPDALLDMADQCLLMAKQSGRNRVVRYHELDVCLADPQSSACYLPLRGLRARDVMAPVMASVRPDSKLHDVFDYLLQLRIDAVPVLGSEGELLGMISEEDLTPCILSEDAWERSAGETMRTNLACFPADSDLAAIFHFFTRVSVRRVVVTEAGRPVGVISRLNLIRWFLNQRRRQAALPRPFERILEPAPTAISETCSTGEAQLPAPLPQAACGSSSAGGKESSGDDLQNPRHLLGQLLREAQQIEQHLHQDEERFAVVAGASRMQELVEQLILHTRNDDSAVQQHESTVHGLPTF